MTFRPLTAVAAGALVAGGLLAVAGPASADPCYPPSPSCAVSSGVQMTTAYDAASRTATVVLTGLKPGSTVTVTVVVPTAAGAAYTPGGMHVAPATYTGGARAVLTAAGSTTVSAVADSRGVATLQVPLAALGALTPAQVSNLVFEVKGTSASGTTVVVQTRAAASTPVTTGSGTTRTAPTTTGTPALPFTGADVLPVAGVGGALVLLGGGTVLAVRRRRDSGTGALGA